MAHRHPSRQLPPRTLGLLLLGLAGVVAYPLAIGWAVERFGVRATSGLLLATGALGLAWRWRSIRVPALRPTQLGVLALLAVSALLDRSDPLLYVPALIQLGLAAGFLASLRDDGSVVEQMARFLQPHLPDWIRLYCRVVTRLWALFFALNGLVIGWLAAEGPVERWQVWSGAGLYLTALGLQGIEAVFRKAWFRAFDDGPVDRVFARLFPPERTARGRRSQSYIRTKRVELGMEEP